jgi:hypothetical protein
MKLKLTIFSPHTKNGKMNEPEQFEFNGNYAIETMLIKISEKYFGLKVSRAIEDLLKTRIGG